MWGLTTLQIEVYWHDFFFFLRIGNYSYKLLLKYFSSIPLKEQINSTVASENLE